jgi:flagellar biogenesis protein FliO
VSLVSLQQAASQGLLGSYLLDLVQAVLALAAVCLLAVAVLGFLGRRGVGVGRSAGPVRVVQRIALEQRRTLYLVRAGDRYLLIGVSEGGGPVLLTELDPEAVGDALPPPTEEEGVSGWLQRLKRRGGE